MNLGGKLSGLKGLVSQSQGKRRFKGDLTPDMISPPLGDFRHTMHVGRGGDVFGDTSFLSNHGGTSNGNGDTDSMTSADNKIGAFFSRTLRHVRKTPDRPRGDSKDLSPPPPPISPIIKNAISLPRLDVELSNGGSPTKTLFSSPAKTQDETTFSYGLESGFVTLPRLSRSERQQSSGSTSCSPDIHCVSLIDATDATQSVSSAPNLTLDPDLIRPASLTSLTSLTSFTFDLGPSLMSEVFGLIDSPKIHLEPSHTWDELEPSFAYGGSEMDSATISLVDSLLRDDCGSRKSPYGLEWTEEDEEVEARMKESMNGQLSPKELVTSLVGYPARERLGMESGGFQSATDVLAQHYELGELLKGQLPKMNVVEEILTNHLRIKPSSYSYTDEEEEIKV
ncbi:cdc42 effector protein 1 [Osmerus mordax]|uniref:cdc42 effector protein 1 n=1 Tax=Osmerus mordax TaxID=8014 RepID=UPI00350FE7B7